MYVSSNVMLLNWSDRNSYAIFSLDLSLNENLKLPVGMKPYFTVQKIEYILIGESRKKHENGCSMFLKESKNRGEAGYVEV